jgi:hypothetical protein
MRVAVAIKAKFSARNRDPTPLATTRAGVQTASLLIVKNRSYWRTFHKRQKPFLHLKIGLKA